MSIKNILILLTIISLCAFFVMFYIFTEEPAQAPENLESMDVYQMLSKNAGQDMTPEELVHVFAQMCEIPVECRSDMVLVEYNNYGDSEYFNIHLVRQFEFSDQTEFVQLHLDLYFPVSEMDQIPRGSFWYDPNIVDIEKVILESEGFKSVQNLQPEEVSVFIDWTW